MAKWILLNKVSLATDDGVLVLLPAREIDEAQFNLDDIRAQGGVVWPATDPQMSQLAKSVRDRQASKGISEDGATLLTYGLALTKLLGLLPTNPSLAQPAWYVDPQNFTGLASDLNDGKTATTPLRTERERRARLGTDGVVFNTTGRLDIYFLSDMTPDDPFDLSEQVVGLNMNIYVHGITTASRTGTLTAVTPIDNVNTTTGGNMLLLTDGAVTWVDKQRITITSGPRAGARAFAKKPLGGGQAAFSTMALPAPGVFDFALTDVVPQVGDPYQVDVLSSMYIAEQRVRSLGHNGALFTRIYVSDFHIRQAGLNWFSVQSSDGLSPFIFDGCLLDPAIRNQAADVQIMNCYASGGILGIGNLVVAMLGGVLTGFCIMEEGSKLILDQDVYVQLAQSLNIDNACRLVIGSAGFFDMTEDCVNIFAGGLVVLGEGSSTIQTEGTSLFGNGNTNRIFDIRSGGQVAREDTFFVIAVKTSHAREFMFGQFDDGFYFDDATATYQPPGGLPTTFANFLAAPPLGFGGYCHHPKTNSKFVSVLKHS